MTRNVDYKISEIQNVNYEPWVLIRAYVVLCIEKTIPEWRIDAIIRDVEYRLWPDGYQNSKRSVCYYGTRKRESIYHIGAGEVGGLHEEQRIDHELYHFMKLKIIKYR